MKNLVSKIIKPLLIPALALSLGVQNSSGQSKQAVTNHIKPYFSSGISIGAYSTLFPRVKPYDGWENHFNDLNGGETFKYTKEKNDVNLDLKVDLGLQTEKATFGATAKFKATYLFKKNPSATVEMDNWKSNYVNISELRKSEKIPSVGVFLKIPFSDEDALIFRDYIGKAKIIETCREDKNLGKNNLKCTGPYDNTEDWTRVFQKNITNVLTNEFSVGYFTIDKDDAKGEVEAYYKTDFKNFHEGGLTFTWVLF